MKGVNAREKIRYVLTRYGLLDKITQSDAKNVDRLTLIRNRLSHDGSFERADDANAADLFIRITEFVVAKTLGLNPSEVFSPKRTVGSVLARRTTMRSRTQECHD